MPTSAKPKKAYRGNKFTLTSREYRVLDEKINDVVGMIRQTQIALLSIVQAATKQQAEDMASIDEELPPIPEGAGVANAPAP